MKKFFSFAIVAMSILGLGSLASCQDSEVENIQQVAFQHSYENSFVKTFGEVSPNQSWDFSSYARHQRLINQNMTRAMTEYQPIAPPGGWYYVESGTLNWLDENLKEGENHRSLVHSTILRTEDRPTIFEIVPIYQGHASLIWKFGYTYKQDGQETATSVTIWEKCQGIQYSDDGETWTTPNNETADGGEVMGHKYVRAKPIRIELDAFTSLSFFLEITKNLSTTNYGQPGDVLRSDAEPTQIGVLFGCPLPNNIHSINEGYHSYIIGVEDCPVETNTHSDKDYNDVVFLLTGYAPEVVYDEEPRTTFIRKRYLIEDLGDTFDFDFNDIVVDVTQKTTTTWVINTETHEATPKEGETPEVEQWATVRWLQGTLPIQVKVGDTYFGQVTDPTADVADIQDQLNRAGDALGGPTCPGYLVSPGRAPEVTKTIVGNTWNPQTNNVTCFVWKAATPTSSPESTEGVWTSAFPGTGEIPYMIAVDQDTQWKGEGEHIPAEWMEGGDMVMP